MKLFLLFFHTILGINLLVFLITPAKAFKALPNYCQQNETLFVVAETQRFWINICGKNVDTPDTYIGVSKSNGQSIRLDLTDYQVDSRSFEASNGDVTYLLTYNTPKGSFLTVTQGDSKELVREYIENWYEQKIPDIFE
jgi:hypothetical protein